jgi:hypothetical protein
MGVSPATPLEEPAMTVAKLPICHPYARISDPTQRKGGGLERQTKADMQEFCRRFEFALSKRIRVDDGVSAFKGLNATPEHELGRFLAEARKGLIPPGDCLLLENWDRLSRQDIWAAIGLVNDLRQLGIHIGRLDRMKLLRCDSTDAGDFFETAVELMRGNSESAAKSDRNGKAWARKRKAARERGAVITRRLPAWVEERDGKLRLIPGPTAAVRRIYTLAAAGYGQLAIVKKLITEGVPPFGDGDIWARSYVAKILKDERVLGRFQPRKRDRSPEGAVIPDYFPPVISEEEFYAARAGCAQRRLRQGALGRHTNVFSGLLMSARDGESYYCTASFGSRQRGGRGPWQRVLKNTASLQGRAKGYTFPFATFESAILSKLAEVDPHEILNGDDSPDEALALSRDLDGVEAELADAAAFMDANGFSVTIGRRVSALEARKARLAAALAEAREKASHPLSETWGQAQSLLALVNGAPDPVDVRLRLRAALRRLTESIWLLVVPRGLTRLAAVQIWFAGGERHRDYLILHRQAKANGSARQEGSWRCWSLAAAVPDDASIDLRDRAAAARLAEDLEMLDLAALDDLK